MRLLNANKQLRYIKMKVKVNVTRDNKTVSFQFEADDREDVLAQVNELMDYIMNSEGEHNNETSKIQ